MQLDEAHRDGRNQILKARASMQGRIRDLEDKIASINAEHADKVAFFDHRISFCSIFTAPLNRKNL